MPKYLIERTEDKITCVYIASSAELILEHAWLGGFPVDRGLEVATILDPTTAESNETRGLGTGVAAGGPDLRFVGDERKPGP